MIIEVFFLFCASLPSFAGSSQSFRLAGTVSSKTNLISYQDKYLVIDPQENSEYKVFATKLAVEKKRAIASTNSMLPISSKTVLKTSSQIVIQAP